MAGLPNTRGWDELNATEQEWLQEHTSSVLTSFRDGEAKAIMFCKEMAAIRAFLKGKPMTFTDWVRSCFGSSERMAYRWLNACKELSGSDLTD